MHSFVLIPQSTLSRSAPVRLVDQERRAELDRQGNGLGFTGIQFLGILGYAIGVQPRRSSFTL